MRLTLKIVLIVTLLLIYEIRIYSHNKNHDDSQSVVINKKGLFVNLTPIPLNHAPKWIKKKIILNAVHVPFKLLVNNMMNDTGVNILFKKNLDTHLPITMQYHGPISGALAKLRMQTGYAYVLQNKEMIWTDMINRTFKVAIKSSISQPRDQIKEVKQIEAPLWNDIHNTLKVLMSKNGKLVISKSISSVTVIDHPENIHAIANYLRQLNQSFPVIQLSRLSYKKFKRLKRKYPNAIVLLTPDTTRNNSHA